MNQIVDNKKAQGGLIIVVEIIILLALGWYFLFAGDSDSSDVTGGVVSDSDGATGNSGNSGGGTKTFILTGENFKFFMNGDANPNLVVNEGDRVRIELLVEDMMHDWKVDEFNAATEIVSAGKSTFVEFTADEKGTFEYYCSVGQHRANGMKGRFIVE